MQLDLFKDERESPQTIHQLIDSENDHCSQPFTSSLPHMRCGTARVSDQHMSDLVRKLVETNMQSLLTRLCELVQCFHSSTLNTVPKLTLCANECKLEACDEEPHVFSGAGSPPAEFPLPLLEFIKGETLLSGRTGASIQHCPRQIRRGSQT